MSLLSSLLLPLPTLSSVLSGDNLAKQNTVFREWSAMRFTPAGPEYQVLCILLDYEGCNTNRVKAFGFVMLAVLTKLNQSRDWNWVTWQEECLAGVKLEYLSNICQNSTIFCQKSGFYYNDRSRSCTCKAAFTQPADRGVSQSSRIAIRDFNCLSPRVSLHIITAILISITSYSSWMPFNQSPLSEQEDNIQYALYRSSKLSTQPVYTDRI